MKEEIRCSSTTFPTSQSLQNSPQKPLYQPRRVESLPDLSQLTVGSHLVIPQPRKAFVSPKVQLHPTNNPFDTYFEEATQIANNPCDAEALHELIRIFASSQERKDIENFLKISPSNDLDSDSESESEGSDHEETLSAHISKKMKIPSLSQSPALIHCEHNQMSLVEESTNDFEFVFGTPPSRAPNPLAFSFYCKMEREGVELDLFRPSPPLFEF